uniref:Uncharacterized protein n=1 Tax=Fusarium oxysporum (strain Fo5176) TaxID=660025 RepID=A0A0C4DJM4_FUSOF
MKVMSAKKATGAKKATSARKAANVKDVIAYNCVACFQERCSTTLQRGECRPYGVWTENP